jgi:hypothetical protein
MRVLTAVTSLATAAFSAWMGLMYFVLRHPGYHLRAAMAAAIFAGAAVFVAGKPPRILRLPAGVWAAALAVLGVWALRAPGDDAWVSIAGVLFVVEGLLALTSTIRS